MILEGVQDAVLALIVAWVCLCTAALRCAVSRSPHAPGTVPPTSPAQRPRGAAVRPQHSADVTSSEPRPGRPADPLDATQETATAAETEHQEGERTGHSREHEQEQPHLPATHDAGPQQQANGPQPQAEGPQQRGPSAPAHAPSPQRTDIPGGAERTEGRRPLRRVVFPGHLWLCPQWQLVVVAVVWTGVALAVLAKEVHRLLAGQGCLPDLWVSMVFVAIGAMVAYMFMRTGYRNYMLVACGPSTQGQVVRVESDATLMVNGMPVTRITYTYTTEQGHHRHEGYHRTFNMAIIQEYPQGRPVTVMYDSANPAINVSPDLHGVVFTDLHAD